MLFNLALLPALLAALTLVTRPVVSVPSVQFTSYGNDSRPIIRADTEGKLHDSLLDKRGHLLKHARIVLEARQKPGFSYGSKKVRGVNIGGWLVAEPWITPSLFDNTGDTRVVDEWTMGKYVDDATTRLKHHWATFYTESDFAAIAAAGLNHVRIPIGYWAFDTSAGEPYVRSNQGDYLEKGIKWSKKYGLKVIIDLHGAPGSQNGFDNSGHLGKVSWPNSKSFARRAAEVISTIAERYAKYDGTVTSIELLNEPAGFYGDNVLSYTKNYYYTAYTSARKKFANAAIMVHDGFQALSYWQGFMPAPKYEQVLLDTHIYSVFTLDQIALSNSDRLQYFCNQKDPIKKSNDNNLWTIVGEWTAAPTDCAKYLNGRGVGARYDGSFGQGSTYIGSCKNKSGDGSKFSSSYKAYLKKMFQTQVSVYEKGSGWVFWTWKTESAADWDYQRGLAGGWITKNLDSLSSAVC